MNLNAPMLCLSISNTPNTSHHTHKNGRRRFNAREMQNDPDTQDKGNLAAPLLTRRTKPMAYLLGREQTFSFSIDTLRAVLEGIVPDITLVTNPTLVT
jgi:hypothetical protein